MNTAPGRVVVVSPHLDDAVLSAWLVLSRAPGARVVTCFAGLPQSGAVGSWDAATASGGGRDAVEARRAEDRRALALTGSEPIHLDMLDAQYRPAAKGVDREPVDDMADGDRLTEQLAAALEPLLRSAEEVWLPAALGGHVDHELARRAALAASAGQARRRLYADLPYAGQPAWPAPVVPGLRNATVDLASRALRTPTPAAVWRSTLTEICDVNGESLTVQRLTGSQRRAKYAAVSEYASQLAALKCGPRNVLRRRRIFAYEVFWTLSSPGGLPQGA